MPDAIRVFIETPAGSRTKHVHDGVTLERLDSLDVPAAYPYAYGFLPDHMAADGECVDCYLITQTPIAAGALLQGRVVGVIEQWEAGAEDHKVLLVPIENDDPHPEVADRIMEFMRTLFEAFPDMLVTVGPSRDARAALQYLTAFGSPRP